MSKSMRLIMGLWLWLVALHAWAVDSYRYLHVTIETPWMIFLFLLVFVLMPFLLMAILYWRYAGRKPADRAQGVNTEQD